MSEPTPWAPHLSCACVSPDGRRCLRARGEAGGPLRFGDEDDRRIFELFDDECSCRCHDHVAERERDREGAEGDDGYA